MESPSIRRLSRQFPATLKNSSNIQNECCSVSQQSVFTPKKTEMAQQLGNYSAAPCFILITSFCRSAMFLEEAELLDDDQMS